ncbi:D-alanyl-D-alanine carboxypeptidase/D-alanyl-D-alanine endopeptidase [Thioclava sp. FR2]|uniref:D-alanyl-D-alanine carboxypeptidase/D-alanyl-D-alanine endopeptidase n=1 Tax=Thioclava sp. FR2 TaxID=3445780 RepID=UPI003EB874A6
MFSRRGFLQAALSGLLVQGLGPALAEAPERSPRPVPRGGHPKVATGSVEALIAAAKLTGVVGFAVLDVANGSVLETHNPDQQVPPASVTKAVTALYALERLGPGFRFRTRVLATGPVQAGIVQGDLVLAGSGDPTLQTDQLGDLAAALAARGIKGVTGRYLVWDGALPSVPHIAGDQPVQVGYNPGLGGLNLNFNRVYFEWKRQGQGWGVTMDARGERFVPMVSMARMKIVGRTAPLFTYATQGSAEDWTVAEGGLGKGGGRWLPVRLPTTYAAEVFSTLTKAQGLALPEAQTVLTEPVGQELAAVKSEPLTDVLHDMLKFSTNVTAECVGLRASGAGSLAASGAAMTEWVRTRFGVANLHVDHSGLGGDSRVTAGDMAKILLGAKGTGLQDILRNVGMKDAKGKAIEGHPVKVVAKSGTLNFVSGLAGYITPPQGRELAFAIFAADVPRRESLAEADRELPPGGEAWTKRARMLQAQLISRWAVTLA